MSIARCVAAGSEPGHEVEGAAYGRIDDRWRERNQGHQLTALCNRCASPFQPVRTQSADCVLARETKVAENQNASWRIQTPVLDVSGFDPGEAVFRVHREDTLNRSLRSSHGELFHQLSLITKQRSQPRAAVHNHDDSLPPPMQSTPRQPAREFAFGKPINDGRDVQAVA